MGATSLLPLHLLNRLPASGGSFGEQTDDVLRR